ncbi:MAG: response regulator [Candidatus Saccharimonadales bacterium]|jgi:DNA-binding response OmpR family regulator
MARILLIESDKILAGNLKSVLKKSGRRIDWQVNPQTAMDSIDRQKPDLVILDLLLAGRGGVEFLYELRSYPDWQNLPIVVFSSVSDRELGRSAKNLQQLGITAFYHKSDTSLAELARSVEQILQPTPA